jgi:hypothetical protein
MDITLDFFVTNYTNELEFVTQRARRKALRTSKDFFETTGFTLDITLDFILCSLVCISWFLVFLCDSVFLSLCYFVLSFLRAKLNPRFSVANCQFFILCLSVAIPWFLVFLCDSVFLSLCYFVLSFLRAKLNPRFSVANCQFFHFVFICENLVVPIFNSSHFSLLTSY